MRSLNDSLKLQPEALERTEGHLAHQLILSFRSGLGALGLSKVRLCETYKGGRPGIRVNQIYLEILPADVFQQRVEKEPRLSSDGSCTGFTTFDERSQATGIFLKEDSFLTILNFAWHELGHALDTRRRDKFVEEVRAYAFQHSGVAAVERAYPTLRGRLLEEFYKSPNDSYSDYVEAHRVVVNWIKSGRSTFDLYQKLCSKRFAQDPNVCWLFRGEMG